MNKPTIRIYYRDILNGILQKQPYYWWTNSRVVKEIPAYIKILIR